MATSCGFRRWTVVVNFKHGPYRARGRLCEKRIPVGTILSSAKPEFTDRFVAVSPDWSQAYAFSAETLSHRPSTAAAQIGAGGTGARSHREQPVLGRFDQSRRMDRGCDCQRLPRAISSWFRCRVISPPAKSDHVRQLPYRGKVNTSETRPRIGAANASVSDGISRRNISPRHPGGAILRAKNPGSLFLLHRTGKELFAPFTLTRMSADGKATWDTATSLRAFAASAAGHGQHRADR